MRCKKIHIGLLIMTLLSLSLFMTGCQSAAEKATEKAIEQSTGGQAKVDVDKDQVTVKTDEGTTTIGGTNQWPDKMPADVPKFNSGKIVSATVSNTTDNGLGIWVGIEGTSMDDLTKYTNQLEAAGWKIESTTTMTDGYMVTASKGEQTLLVSFSKSNDTFGGAIMYNQKK